MSENKADPLREALKPLAAISLWRDKYQDGPDMLTNDKLARYFTADQVRAARAALAAPQPAAPLGGREAIARIIYSYEYGYEPDEYQIERSNPGKKCLGIADAILAAIPQERGVEREAIIEECVKAAESVEMGRKWSDDPDMQNQGYYTEGEILVEIVDAIRALGKETGR